MIRKALALSLLLVATTFTTAAHAVTLVSYEFGGLSATSSDPMVTAGDVTNADLGIFDPNFNGSYATQPVLRVAPSNPVSTSVDNAFSNDNFFSFTIEAAPGKVLDLDSLTFNVGQGGSSNPRNLGVRTSVTGTTNIFVQEVGAVRPNFSSYSVDLSAIAGLQQANGPITLSIAVATGNTGRSLEFDDIQVNGEVVPEPATFGLLGAAGLALLARRRRTA